MNAYLDASTFTTLPLNDEGWEALERWLSKLDTDPTYSDLTWGEFVSAVATRVRRRQLEADEAGDLISATAAVCASWRRSILQPDDLAEATRLVANFALKLRLPDALHIVIARRTDCTLITTDRQQAKAAAMLGHAVLNPLTGETSP